MGQLISACCGVDEDHNLHSSTRRCKSTATKYESYEELQTSLQEAGLETSHLLIAIDYTRSNDWNGKWSFGKSLHYIDPSDVDANPYQAVIRALGKTLEAFDKDQLIRLYGFGDATTRDVSCFKLDDAPCRGFTDALERYKVVTPTVALAGPTSFTPIIEEAVRLVKATQQYHILVIIADGQVTCETETADSIVAASNSALSIIMVGVGDGPWDMMNKYSDKLTRRRFENFQFVEYNKVLEFNVANPQVGFAAAALAGIPAQYKTIRQLGLLPEH
ncbi:hypothetical protein SDRG_09555 [Saprolegnia diclina VS20]|uniref:VWFA domain-containing protein n=1 Tax=Saprolegnia diclina (strain VS20) TaxID=1156394 RepID=T0QHB8_SAPDV|nr:hypothetical protein SDRG_09555 [Saprolegnia diclina VS20]EQC33035.1 hypothetical protein SDRG_09555 [Saprolegnia diclina VS20]|eukprot:XP_008613721.1 hypothetical protein SDRG_09555 [Saprolegnia diclina VS20]